MSSATTADPSVPRQGGIDPVDLRHDTGDALPVLLATPLAASTDLPMVSVVLTTRGRPEQLSRCLRSLMAQTFDPDHCEILVVDTSGSERARSLLQWMASERGGPALHHLRLPRGHGTAAMRNAGWRRARGDIVAFIDDSTLPMPDWLAQGVAEMHKGQFAAVGGRIIASGAARQPAGGQRPAPATPESEFLAANAFVRLTALLQVQGYDERFAHGPLDDCDLLFRLRDGAGMVGRCEGAAVLQAASTDRTLRSQRDGYYHALLRAKHPGRCGQVTGQETPWDCYAIVSLALATALFIGIDIPGSAAVCLLLTLAGLGAHAGRLLRGRSHRTQRALGLALGASLIPFLAVYWRLRGSLRFRVWFL